jgi:hypothetical protein
VPIDFPDPIANDRVYGRMLGSSHRLRDELVSVARYLGIQLGAALADDEAERINREMFDGPFAGEKMAWICLFEAARLSLEHTSAIVFF